MYLRIARLTGDGHLVGALWLWEDIALWNVCMVIGQVCVHFDGEGGFFVNVHCWKDVFLLGGCFWVIITLHTLTPALQLRSINWRCFLNPRRVFLAILPAELRQGWLPGADAFSQDQFGNRSDGARRGESLDEGATGSFHWYRSLD